MNSMLGVFDSGLGGLAVLRAIHERLGELGTVYWGDSARFPYGTQDQETIFKWTLDGVRELFRLGAPLVILACNTASASALRRIQQEILPREFPDRRVLGVIRPIVEDAAVTTKTKHVGVLATRATVASHAYRTELQKIDPEISVTEESAGEIVADVEGGLRADEHVRAAVQQILAYDPRIDTLVLGCTHFSVLHDLFLRSVPLGVAVVGSGAGVANKLAAYLTRHPELAARLDQSSTHIYLTTGDQFVASKASGITFQNP